MTSIAIAIIFTVIVFTIYPPSFTITKVLKVEEPKNQSITTSVTSEITKDEKKKMYDDAPPNIDDLVQGINQILFDIQGDE